ncbi:hypothetical protein OG874_32020 [Nocardia sp. NBC_00565]|uniref:hypothetical protein n=1 Tax=Nocardia sp. NBC_00565 TaxID=2975993 RepID=UPI002E802E10|nr:hypothetical protein [Nocardia sp. NBC_00565]WUC01396.1 hypothetical protein OG874_32020 [Nocardia sp. NBC_00565]
MERSSNPMLAHQVEFGLREQAFESFFLSDRVRGAWRGGAPRGFGFYSGKQRNLVRMSTM